MADQGELTKFARRVPTVVIVGLCAALLAYWTEAPLWLPYGLAAALAGLALVLMVLRSRRPIASGRDDPNTDWLATELAGYGSPPGTYLLAFFAIMTVALTGFDGAYALPAWAALLLIAAWAAANAQPAPAEES